MVGRISSNQVSLKKHFIEIFIHYLLRTWWIIVVHKTVFFLKAFGFFLNHGSMRAFQKCIPTISFYHQLELSIDSSFHYLQSHKYSIYSLLMSQSGKTISAISHSASVSSISPSEIRMASISENRSKIGLYVFCWPFHLPYGYHSMVMVIYELFS